MSNTWWFNCRIDDIGLVIFAKVKLHPSMPKMRSVVHRAMTCLIVVPEVGKLGGCMWLWVANQLVLWVFYNGKTLRQHFILLMTTLETWHNQYWHSSWFSLANDPCGIYYWCCPLTQHWMIKYPPNNTTLESKEFFIMELTSTLSSTPITTISNSLVLIHNC